MSRLKNRVKVLTPGGPDVTFTQTFTIRVDWSERDVEGSPAGDTRQAAATQAADLAGHIKDAYLARYTALESQRTKDATRMLQEQSLARPTPTWRRPRRSSVSSSRTNSRATCSR